MKVIVSFLNFAVRNSIKLRIVVLLIENFATLKHIPYNTVSHTCLRMQGHRIVKNWWGCLSWTWNSFTLNSVWITQRQPTTLYVVRNRTFCQCSLKKVKLTWMTYCFCWESTTKVLNIFLMHFCKPCWMREKRDFLPRHQVFWVRNFPILLSWSSFTRMFMRRLPKLFFNVQLQWSVLMCRRSLTTWCVNVKMRCFTCGRFAPAN